jgi:DNA-directed RNA polymerase specialized sigma subunit
LTKEELSKLRKIKTEIDQIRRELENIEPEYTQDSVTGSYTCFPYTQHPIKIAGYAIDSYERKVQRIQSRLNRKLTELVEEKDRLTEFIYSIDDGDLRQILTYRYMNGLTWKEIGEHMNYATSTIRLKHDGFIKKISTF